MSDYAFDGSEGDWRVTGTYEPQDNIVFYYQGYVFRTLTFPAYKIWNIPAHFSDIVADFENGMEMAAWNGLPSPPQKGSETS